MGKTETLACGTCKAVYAANANPEKDKKWHKNIEKATSKGDIHETGLNSYDVEFGDCKC